MSYRILVVNPGSTSTKIGVYEDEQLLFDKTLRHSAEEIAQFNTIPAQKDWRRDLVMKALREQGFDARTLSAVSGRGGLALAGADGSGPWRAVQLRGAGEPDRAGVPQRRSDPPGMAAAGRR